MHTYRQLSDIRSLRAMRISVFVYAHMYATDELGAQGKKSVRMFWNRMGVQQK